MIISAVVFTVNKRRQELLGLVIGKVNLFAFHAQLSFCEGRRGHQIRRYRGELGFGEFVFIPAGMAAKISEVSAVP